MAKETIQQLEPPEKLDELLKKERREADCTGCRVIGGGACIALGAYSYSSGMSQLEKNRARILASKTMFSMRTRKMGITGISLGLVYMGIYRLFR